MALAKEIRRRRINEAGLQKRKKIKELREQGWTLAKIGKHFSPAISRERVRQLLKG
jgi:DNA-directed RNA polymerase sigma subunit (sigma70/sigma32)